MATLSMGFIHPGFDIRTKGVELLYDPATQQQELSFHFAAQVSIPQLLRELASFQNADGAPSAGQDVGARRPPPPPLLSSSGAPDLSSATSASWMPLTAPPAVAVVGGRTQANSLQSAPPAQQPGSRPSGCAARRGAAGLQGSQPAPGFVPAQPPGQTLPLVQAPPGVPAPSTAAPDVAAPVAMPPGTAAAAPPPPNGQASSTPPPPSDEAGPRDNGAMDELIKAVVQGNAEEARAALQKGNLTQDPASPLLASPLGGSLLIAALDAGGRADLVSMLLQAQCNVNAAGPDGSTPLHRAISQHAQLSPTVVRLLLCARANPNALRADGTATPAEMLRALTQDPSNVSGNIRQIAEEVADRPTVLVGLVEQEVVGAKFADTGNDNVVFFTHSSIGLFSVSQNRVALKQRLSQQRVQSVVHDLFVNPELGTIGVFVEVTGASDSASPGPSVDVQNLIIIWPSGQLQEEEPLRIGIDQQPGGRDAQPPALASSTTAAPLVLVGRLCGGNVVCWHFNRACSQIVAEQPLLDQGGLLAVSGGGSWVAVTSPPGGSEGTDSGSGRIHLWSCTRRGKADSVLTLDRQPQTMAITEQRDAARAGAGAGGLALLALFEQSSGMPDPTVEVLEINSAGSWASLYRLRMDMPCISLSFCLGASILLLSATSDGVVIINDLQTGQFRISHDAVSLSGASISSDHSLLITTLADSFRVFRPGTLTVAPPGVS